MQGNNVIATTTAIAYPRDTPNKPDVCIVRLLVSLYVPVDVNLDLVINQTDYSLVVTSPYYNIILSDESTCPLNADGQRMCGRADVNFDGFVNQLDTTAISQSADYVQGTNLPCGGVYATAFSCGSTRRAPLTPAVDISLDSIVYFDNDGNFGPATPARKRAALESSVMNVVLTDFEHLQGRLVELRSQLTEVDVKIETKAAAVDSMIDIRVIGLDSKNDSRMAASQREVAAVQHEVAAVRHEVADRLSAVDAKLDQHERVMRHALPVSQREVLAGASAAVGGIVLCGVAVYFIAKRR